MLKFAITGADSFIGKHMVSLLAANNCQVNALSRKNIVKSDFQQVTYFKGDLLARLSLCDFLKDCDVVINFAYLWDATFDENITAIENLASIAAQYGIKRFIHCSTSSVYGSNNKTIIDEDSTCLPDSNYAKCKLAIEDILLTKFNHVFELVIIRPTQVFGNGGKNLMRLVNDLTTKSIWKNYLKSCLLAHRNMNLIFVENVTTAVFYLAHRNVLMNKIYLVSDDNATFTFKYIENYLIKQLEITNYKIPRFSIPLIFYKVICFLTGKGLINPKTIYLGKNLKKEGYVKSVRYDEGLELFVKWFKRYPHL